MLNKVRKAFECFNLLQDKRHITVALSGGADSMALLCAMCELKGELGLEKVSAAHFNHQIRGPEALRDQNFVEEYCHKNGIELYIGTHDVPSFAKENGISLELAARELRYAFLSGLNTDLIATAHTASDNLETVIFNITRGTALSGLCGIPPKRDKYIRPLIFCTRDEIEHYCAQKNLEFVTDSTNLCDDYTRNKIRHNIVPVLKEINSACENAITRMSVSIRDDDNFIKEVVDQKYDALISTDGLQISEFVSLHVAIAKRIIAKYCSVFNIEPDAYHINSIYDICLSGGKISLPHDMSALVQDGILKIENAKKQIANTQFSVKIEQRDNDLFNNTQKVHNLLLKNIIDCDKIVGQLVVRTRESGDTLRLKNKNCTKTLKKLCCEYKIPLDERETLPVLADDLGVVWVHKIGVAERCAADEKSSQIYKILVEKI